MIVVLVLNGEPPTAAQLAYASARGEVYAADGGARCCLEYGIRPRKVIGDFDSLDLTRLPADWDCIHRPDQNATDFQKVLSILPHDVEEMMVLGGLGARLDHTLTNLLIAGALPPHIRIQFAGASETLVRVTPETPFKREVPVGDTLSLLPLQAVNGVTTVGLKWNLSGQDMGPGEQLGQSNEVTASEVSVTVQTGCLWLWI